MTGMQAEIINDLTHRYAESAQAAGRASVALTQLAHSVRSMLDLFGAIRRSEASWRSAVYLGGSPYLVDEDAAYVNLYRQWALSAKTIIDASEEQSVSPPGRGRLVRRYRLVEWFLDDPPTRLIDVPRVGIDVMVRRKPIVLRSAESYLTEHPDKSERAVEAASRSDEDSVLLSDYLASRRR